MSLPSATARGEHGASARVLLAAFACAAPGLAPWLIARDPLAACAWLAIVAFPIGVVAAHVRLPLWPWSATVPALWLAALALGSAASSRVLPTPAWAGCAWSGLYLLGWAAGWMFSVKREGVVVERAWIVAAWSALLVLALAGLPVGLGLVDGAFSPSVSARLIDLSPATCVLECAGVDWMRHPALYEAARTFDIGPELRAPYRGALAGPALLLLGCAVAGLSARTRGET